MVEMRSCRPRFRHLESFDAGSTAASLLTMLRSRKRSRIQIGHASAVAWQYSSSCSSSRDALTEPYRRRIEIRCCHLQSFHKLFVSPHLHLLRKTPSALPTHPAGVGATEFRHLQQDDIWPLRGLKSMLKCLQGQTRTVSRPKYL